MPTEGVYVPPSGSKMFIPLENNPDVFTSLIHDLGVSQELGFYDVYSVDAEALSLMPRPALALIFISPPPMYHAVRAEDGIPELTGEPTYDNSGREEPVMWFRQTISNACGLIALLYAVANGEARRFVESGSMLDKLLSEATPLKAVVRAAALYDNEELERVHMRAARLGSTAAPRANEHPNHHFLAFVKGGDGHLWELEGCVDGPIYRGELGDDEDMLSDAALDKGVRRFLKHAGDNLEFSIVVLAQKPAE